MKGRYGGQPQDLRLRRTIIADAKAEARRTRRVELRGEPVAEIAVGLGMTPNNASRHVAATPGESCAPNS